MTATSLRFIPRQHLQTGAGSYMTELAPAIGCTPKLIDQLALGQTHDPSHLVLAARDTTVSTGPERLAHLFTL
jgi:hypothetical protein